MKKFNYLIILLTSVVLFNACDEEVDVPALVSTAPVINSGDVKTGVALDQPIGIQVEVTDGSDGFSSSPLSSVSLVVLDTLDNEVFSLTPSISTPTRALFLDTLSLANAANGFPVGDYRVITNAQDSEGQTATDTVEFVVRESEFAFVQTGVWVLGSFNGWGANTPDLAMTLVADNTWELEGVVATTGDQFKFANTPDFSDVDWTDPECDGTAVDGTGVQENIACFPFNATYTFRFNDLSLAYEIVADIDIPTVFPDLYLLASSDNFESPGNQLSVADTNRWTGSLNLSANDLFRFSTTPTITNMTYGDNEPDGVLDEFGSFIRLPDGSSNGIYIVEVNDLTFEYSFTLDCSSTRQDGIWVLGQMNGWGANTPDLGMSKIDDDNWTISGVAASNGDAFKFANTNNFTGIDWGDNNCDGVAIQGTGDNIACIEADGNFTITFNTCSLEYSITQE
ncbi:MAG: hypothetical protein AAFX87_00255 [Bacteroidota bacterium]